MIVRGTESSGQAASPNRSWGLALLTPTEPGRRNRRPVDAAVLGAAAVLTGLTAVVAKSAPEVDEEVAQALVTVFGWAPHFWRIVFVGALLFALVIVADATCYPTRSARRGSHSTPSSPQARRL